MADIGAGTGLFSSVFARALPDGTVHALEVRADALRTLHERASSERLPNLLPLRIDEGCVPALPGGTAQLAGRAHLVFVCDVLDFLPPERREGFLLSLRAILAPAGATGEHSAAGRLLVVESRDTWESHLVDIQDAGFVQRRFPQIVQNRRVMAFEADPSAPPPPAPPPPPPPRPEDSEPPLASDAPPPPSPLPPPPSTQAEAAGGRAASAAAEKNGSVLERQTGIASPPHAAADGVDDDDGGCMLEENASDTGVASAEIESDDDGGCMLEENEL